MRIERILVPIDFSELSQRAAEHALAQALHFDAELLFLHVIPPPPAEHVELIQDVRPEEAEAQRQYLDKRLHAFARRAALGRPHRQFIASGDPAQRICALAAAEQADLLVMPSRGHGAFRRLLLGSTTAKVLHDCAVPVLTGAHLADGPPFRSGPIDAVACALALRDPAHSEKVLRFAWDYALSWDAKLHVIHVPQAVELGVAEWFPPDTIKLVREAAAERLQDLMTRVGAQGQFHVEGGSTSDYVVSVMKQTGSDVLIVGRSSGGFGLHSNAYALIKASPGPVLSV